MNRRLVRSLRAGFSIAGRVVDMKGKGIAGAQVTTAAVWDMPGSGHRAETDAKGQFTLDAVAPGTHVLVANDGTHAPARSTPILVEAKPVTGIELVMQAGGTIRGRVFDHADVPAVFATVRVAGDGPQMGLVDSRQTTTDKDGKFEITGLARTKLKVDVAASEVVPVDLTEQGDKTDLKLKLSVTGTIAGIIVDELGQVVPEVQVNAFPEVFLGGSVGMKFWLGEASRSPSSTSSSPAATRCARSCKQAKIGPSPTKQTFVHDVPAMTPLPTAAP